MFSSKFMNQFNWRNHINSSGFISTSSCVSSWLLGGVPQANRLCLLSFLQKGLFQIKLELIIFNLLLKLARSASDWPAQGSQGIIAWCHLLNQRNAATAHHRGRNPKKSPHFCPHFWQAGTRWTHNFLKPVRTRGAVGAGCAGAPSRRREDGAAPQQHCAKWCPSYRASFKALNEGQRLSSPDKQGQRLSSLRGHGTFFMGEHTLVAAPT